MSAHIELAKKLLQEAEQAKTGSDVEASRQSAALVNAVIGLAEQQRIANLIALLQLGEGDIRDFGSQGVVWPQVTRNIREGLGL